MSLMSSVLWTSNASKKIALFAFWFAFFAVIVRIRFAWQWVWRTWVLLLNLWYVIFLRFFCGLTIYVVSVSVVGYGTFAPAGVESKGDIFGFDIFVPIGVEYKCGKLIKIFLALKLLIFFPNLKPSFIVVVLVRLFLTHSNRCSFTKNIIRRSWMGIIRRSLDYGRGGTETTALIQCTVGREPQIHKWWCLVLDWIYRKDHPTSRVKVLSVTVE